MNKGGPRVPRREASYPRSSPRARLMGKSAQSNIWGRVMADNNDIPAITTPWDRLIHRGIPDRSGDPRWGRGNPRWGHQVHWEVRNPPLGWGEKKKGFRTSPGDFTSRARAKPPGNRSILIRTVAARWITFSINSSRPKTVLSDGGGNSPDTLDQDVRKQTIEDWIADLA